MISLARLDFILQVVEIRDPFAHEKNTVRTTPWILMDSWYFLTNYLNSSTSKLSVFIIQLVGDQLLYHSSVIPLEGFCFWRHLKNKRTTKELSSSSSPAHTLSKTKLLSPRYNFMALYKIPLVPEVTTIPMNICKRCPNFLTLDSDLQNQIPNLILM